MERSADSAWPIVEGTQNGSYGVLTEWIHTCNVVVDAGTIELIRSFGVEVVSSADLFQVSAATWSRDALQSHVKAAKELDKSRTLRSGTSRVQLRRPRLSLNTMCKSS